MIHVNMSSRLSIVRIMNVAIESAHCGCERNSKMYGKNGRIMIQGQTEHCIKVRNSGSRTCLGQSVYSRPLSSLVPQRLVSHRNACELSLMEAVIHRMVNNGMGSNMYRCVRFPHSAKNMVL